MSDDVGEKLPQAKDTNTRTDGVSESIGRGLNAAERIMLLLARVMPLNVSVAAEVTGAPHSIDVWRAATAAVQARHPMLRVRVADAETNAPRFEGHGVGPIPLRWVDAATDWRDELEREMNLPFAVEQGPLARVVVCLLGDTDRKNVVFVVTVHHCIGDGRSCVLIARDLLQAVIHARKTPAPTDDLLPRLGPSPDIEGIIAPRYSKFRKFRSLVSSALPGIGKTLRYGPPVSPRIIEECPRDRRTLRALQRSLDSEMARRLSDRAKTENTTVHGALGAALVMATLADVGHAKKKSHVALSSAVDLRNRVQPNIGDDIGLYVTMSFFQTALGKDHAFWDLARSIRHSITREIETDQALVSVALSPTMFGMMGADRYTPSEIVEKMSKTMPQTVAFTNLGRLDFPERFEDMEIDAIYFSPGVPASSHFTTSALSVRGRIGLGFYWHEPLMGVEQVTAIADGIVQQIENACAS